MEVESLENRKMYLSANKLKFRSPPVALAVYSRIAGGPALYRRAQRCESPLEADMGWVPFRAAEGGGSCGSYPPNNQIPAPLKAFSLLLCGNL